MRLRRLLGFFPARRGAHLWLDLCVDGFCTVRQKNPTGPGGTGLRQRLPPADDAVQRRQGACSGPSLNKCLACSAQEYGRAKGAMATVSVLSMKAALRRRVTGIHAVSYYVSQLMTRQLMHGPGQVATIVAPDWRQSPGDLLPHDESELARLPSRPFILYVGAFRLLKGIDQLLRAYERLETEVPLVVIGTLPPTRRPSRPMSSSSKASPTPPSSRRGTGRSSGCRPPSCPSRLGT